LDNVSSLPLYANDVFFPSVHQDCIEHENLSGKASPESAPLDEKCSSPHISCCNDSDSEGQVFEMANAITASSFQDFDDDDDFVERDVQHEVMVSGNLMSIC